MSKKKSTKKKTSKKAAPKKVAAKKAPAKKVIAKKSTAKKVQSKKSTNKGRSLASTANSNGDLAYSILTDMINFQLNNDSYSKNIKKSEVTAEMKSAIEKWLNKEYLGPWDNVEDQVLMGSYSDDENCIFIFTIRSQETVDCYGKFTFFNGRDGSISYLGDDIECRD